MSREQVDLVRRGIEVWREEGPDAWIDRFIAQDAVFVQDTSVGPDARTWSGQDGWRAAIREWVSAFDDWSVDFEDAVDAGDGRVLVVFSDSGRGQDSGVLVERPRAAMIHTVRDGKIVHTLQYGRVEEAFDALGLGE